MDKNWESIKTLFFAAIDLPENQREEYLNNNCDDPVLKQEIYSLLSASRKSEEFLENPLVPVEEVSNENIFIGKYFGRYRIEKLIARGGMGLVFLGVRDDTVKQKAAIKIINPGYTSGLVIKRFENERQTLANLNHSNISRLLDGGITDDGIQYLTMEYIDGIPIDIYCESKKLNISERLELFLKITAIVQYAHQNLVIHKDLKPGNILVTADGEPKLLDFGISKLLDPEDNHMQTITIKGAWNLTPEYASPEQVNGGNITTASDVYSLGVILYKLLTGHNPYNIKSKIHSDIINTITREEPLKPSAAVIRMNDRNDPDSLNRYRDTAADKISKILSGDLDNIIAMAIRKEPQRRYQSVLQLSEDIKRYLNNQPVIAHRDSFSYRTGKFIKRNRTGVISAVVILLIILSGIIGIIWQSRLTAKERDIARNEADRANRIKSFLVNMISAPDPKLEGGEVKVIDVIQNASGNLTSELSGHPRIEAEIRTLIGNTYQNLGIYDSAESEINKALKINTQLFGENSIEAAGSIKDLGLVYHYKGDYEKTEMMYKKALGMYKALEDKPSFETAKALDLYGTLMTDMGNYKRAEELTLEALAIAEKHRPPDDYDLGIIKNNLATAYNYLKKLDKADSLYMESLKIFRKKYGNNSILVSSTLNNLAFIHIFNKEHNKALPFLEEALNIKIKILGENHPDLILSYSNLGSTYFNDNQFALAETIIKKSVDVALRNYSENNINVSRAYMWYGRALEANGKADKGLYYLQKAYEIRRKEFGEQNKLTLQTRGMYAKCLITVGRIPEAEKHLIGSYKGLKEIAGIEDESTAKTLTMLIDLYKVWGKKKEADYYAQFIPK